MPRLANVRTPTLVIHGDVDPLVRVEGGMDTAKSVPGAKLHVVKRMGHALPKELWPEIVGAIVDHAKAHNS
ncbi:MAG: alpha/beta hydrolase [Rhodoblastus sp.]